MYKGIFHFENDVLKKLENYFQDYAHWNFHYESDLVRLTLWNSKK
jgi:hypothetical protein